MPNIVVRVPCGVFTTEGRAILVSGINAAAALAEQIPDEPQKRRLCWVLVDEVASGLWTCGATDMTQQVLPCLVQVFVPVGVLDSKARDLYVKLIHQACQAARPASDQRVLLTSVLLLEVADGAWGVNGAIWRLDDFAQAAGFAHLQPGTLQG